MAELEQRRILKTAIPGPRSVELMARKTGAVASKLPRLIMRRTL